MDMRAAHAQSQKYQCGQNSGGSAKKWPFGSSMNIIPQPPPWGCLRTVQRLTARAGRRCRSPRSGAPSHWRHASRRRNQRPGRRPGRRALADQPGDESNRLEVRMLALGADDAFGPAIWNLVIFPGRPGFDRRLLEYALAIAFISLMWQPLHVIGHRFEQHILVNRHSLPVFVDDLGWPVKIDRQVSLTFVKLRLADRHGQKAV
jgi:hypothetical protein